MCESNPMCLNCIISCKMHWICPWMMDVDFVPVACCCYSGWASVCSMLMSLYSQASVYFLWIDRDTSSWTFIAPLSDVYLRELTQVTRLYWLPPASHPQCLFFFRFAFSYNFFSHVCTWAEWQWQGKNETNCENVTTEAIKTDLSLQQNSDCTRMHLFSALQLILQLSHRARCKRFPVAFVFFNSTHNLVDFKIVNFA